MTIEPDYSKDELFTPLALQMMKDRYLVAGENSPQDAFIRVCTHFSDNEEHAKRLYHYVSNHWFMFATPVLANGGTTRGLPISCYLGYIPDDSWSICNALTEAKMLTRTGGGVGYYAGDLRSDGEVTSQGSKSTGVIGFIKEYETAMLAWSQGPLRRGAVAMYMDISHPEIEEFIVIRKSGGDPNRRCVERKVFHHAVNIPDTFMRAVDEGNGWNLIDPHSKTIKKHVNARELWEKILDTRAETGEPYLHFIDTSNKAIPKALKDKGMEIKQSNLCNEIFLPTNKDRTAVCCLSSVNIEKYDEWKDDSLFIEDLIRMLDNVLSDFVNQAQSKPGFNRAAYSAMMERSLGLGAMGFCSYLQKKMVPFESGIALGYTNNIFSNIREKADLATMQLATEKGEAPDMEGTGKRNAHLMAIAPNASTSILIEVSPCIESYATNIFSRKTDSGTFTVKNKILEEKLKEYGWNTDEVWKKILDDNGSIQNIDFMPDSMKEVFKTAFEIDQAWVIEHASHRQKHIDQGQSVNVFIPSNAHKSYIMDIHFKAWQKGLKGLYYYRSTAAQSNDNVNAKIVRNKIEDDEDCIACEG